jgi:cyclin-dependent kinase 9
MPDLLDKLLVLDPSKQYDSDSALKQDLFCTHPMSCYLSNITAQHKQSMFNYFAPPHWPGHMQAQHYEIMDCAFPDRIYCLVIYVKINSIPMNWPSEIFVM